MKNIIGAVLSILLLVKSGYCQQRSDVIKPLTVGDSIPSDLVLTNIYNYQDSTIRLADLKGKLVILDFWYTGCTSCINGFPRLYELQKEFGSRLQFILVDSYRFDSIGKVQPLMEKLNRRTGMNIELPTSLQQSGIRTYFPYRSVPHFVWIGPGGKIIATTSSFEVSRNNILAALQTEQVKMRNKVDLLLFDEEKPLFVGGNAGNGDSFYYRTILTGYIEGIGGQRATFDSAGLVTRFSVLNVTAMSLLQAAFPKLWTVPLSHIVNEVSQPSAFQEVSSSDSDYYNRLLCFEIITPPATIDALRLHLQQEIPRLLRVKVSTEVRRFKCLVIRKGKNINKIYSKGGKLEIQSNNYTISKVIRNMPFSTFILYLNSMEVFRNMPVIDDSGIIHNIDLDLPYSFFKMDQSSVRAYLESQGLTFTEEERPISVTVISDASRNVAQ